MYTAELTLARAWLVDPTDPTTDPIVCGTARPNDTVTAEAGEYREYAGNRIQLVLSDLSSAQVPLVLKPLTQHQSYRLEHDWIGKLLLLRTVDGQRVFGAYDQIQTKRHLRISPDGGESNVAYELTLTFVRVTYNEAV